MNERDDEDDPLMDWALGERLGGEKPPDLVDAVRRRSEEAAPAHRPPRQLMAAALVLIGAAVVCGVGFWAAARDGANQATDPATPPQGPMPSVRTVEDVAKLPVSTREVEVNAGDDHVIEALSRLGGLEALIVREPWNEAFGLSPKMQPGVLECPVTNVSWQHFAKLKKLRRLELRGTRLAARVEGAGGEHVIAALETLPLLESLTMAFLDTPDATLTRLPRLRQLRHLDLSFNHGFTEEGVEAIVACRSLRSLSLRGCQQLHGTWLARLNQLPDLERLDLSLMDGINWWNGTKSFDGVDEETMKHARGWADSLNAGVQDGALVELAKLPRLRVLEIGGGPWSGIGLAALRNCTTLEELGMAGGRITGDDGFVKDLPKGLRRLEVCGPFRDDFCAAVREHLVNLRELCVAACDQITDAGLRELVSMPSLRVLDMRQMRGLTAACVESLAGAQQLTTLDVRHCPFVTAEHVARLRRELPGLKLEATVPVEPR